MAETADNRFIDGMGARVIAGVIGIGIVAFMVAQWGDEMQQFASSFSAKESTPLIQPIGQERVSEDNPGLKACLEERVGHVNQMKKDGVISEQQFKLFANRAKQLCQAQNPG